MKEKRNHRFAGKNRIVSAERRRCSGRLVIVVLLVCYPLLGIMLIVSSSLDQPSDQNHIAIRADDHMKTENFSSDEGAARKTNDLELDEAKSKFILDQVALDQLPIIFPHTFNVPSGRSYGELLHASWPKNKNNKAQRLYGVGPTAKDPPEGQTVQGDWPDLLDRLTYIPLLKNGHTSLSNAFGDLRQRLNGTVESLNQAPLKATLPPRAGSNRTLQQRQPCTDLLEWAVTHPNFPHKLFTVLRDPIDRFISATCEDLRQNSLYRKACLKSNWTDTLTCVIENLPTRANPKPFKPHQDLQTKQLHAAVRGKAVGVAVISFSNLSDIMSDLGCTTHSTKVRDRKSSEYTNIVASKIKRRHYNFSDATRENARFGAISKRFGQNVLTPPNIKVTERPWISGIGEIRSRFMKGARRHRRLSTLTLQEIRAMNKETNRKSSLFYRQHQAMQPSETASALDRSFNETMATRNQGQVQSSNSTSRIQRLPIFMTAAEKEKSDKALNSFCQIHGDDLSLHQINRLCEAYHLDVELMESVGIPVPHCAQYLTDLVMLGDKH